MYSQAPNASFSGTCETAKHHVLSISGPKQRQKHSL